MNYLGYFLIPFTILQIFIAISFGWKGEYELSRESENLALLWLIATLICLK